MSARNGKPHPRQEYLDIAIKVDKELGEAITALQNEIMQLYDGKLSYPLVTDDLFSSLLNKRGVLDRFPLTVRDFSDLVFYQRSTVGLPGFQIDNSRVDADGQLEIIIPVDIKKKDFDSLVWKAIKPYLRTTKNKGPERLNLVYAVKKARKNQMKPRDILLELRQGSLPSFAHKTDLTSTELNSIISLAEKSMSFKDTL